jgi:quinol monooxygenase YgiN
MAYVVIARWTARPGREEEVRSAIIKLIAPSRAERGSRWYQPSQDPRNPRVFVLFEVYDDEAAYQAHTESEHFQRLAVEGAIPLLESREREFYETIGEPA